MPWAATVTLLARSQLLERAGGCWLLGHTTAVHWALWGVVSSWGMPNISQHAKYAEVRQIRQIPKPRFQMHVTHTGCNSRLTKTVIFGMSKKYMHFPSPSALSAFQHATFMPSTQLLGILDVHEKETISTMHLRWHQPSSTSSSLYLDTLSVSYLSTKNRFRATMFFVGFCVLV